VDIIFSNEKEIRDHLKNLENKNDPFCLKCKDNAKFVAGNYLFYDHTEDIQYFIELKIGADNKFWISYFENPHHMLKDLRGYYFDNLFYYIFGNGNLFDKVDKQKFFGKWMNPRGKINGYFRDEYAKNFRDIVIKEDYRSIRVMSLITTKEPAQFVQIDEDEIRDLKIHRTDQYNKYKKEDIIEYQKNLRRNGREFPFYLRERSSMMSFKSAMLTKSLNSS